ncbi:nucleoside 2-deoxyribosyltransferase [Winogradskyella sediminis]|uniref:nucleoside 2-deoxyribosyltransferase n=1 Tax=Winogradskyella sediminis TaxID=1382466 RepID=UPI000E281C3C|nr:nucleoside 2-deoxyribosyltransferase [Winogradskyella sediminis]REG89374.1 nucleoside 2-deoxyribosyltransferase-like protein [Winogradskyella sediminis]
MDSKFYLVGDIVIDVSLFDNAEKKMRLGGIAHAMRGFWALNRECVISYFVPEFLNKEVIQFSKHHGFDKIEQLGTVIGAPYVFLIGSVKETGDQEYDFLLREKVEIEYNYASLKTTKNNDNILFIAGNYDVYELIEKRYKKSKLHIDLSNNINTFSDIPNCKFETIFISTSSNLFLDNYNDSFEAFCGLFEKFCNVLVLKENRGGSRIYDFVSKQNYKIPSITQPIVHSVGVGDVYNACYVSHYEKKGIEHAGYLASWVASEYALTTFPDDFKKNIARVLQAQIKNLISMGGCSLPWENRNSCSIYIAAPDFDYLDTTIIDNLVSALEYHNFRPRRPIKENGQISENSTREERGLAFVEDINLIAECKILIAIYMNDDPGTMIELGYARANGIPCLLYDPFSKAKNNMLIEIPNTVSSELDVIISEVFNLISKINE